MKENQPRSILIMEDNVAIADALELLLGEEGFRVTTWGGGANGPPLQEPFPDVILLDLLLSGNDGSLLCRELKADETTRAIPVIVMSANTRTPQIAREAGADGWIMKPFEVSHLLSMLEKHMRNA